MIELINDWFIDSDGMQYILRQRKISKRKDTEEEYETSKDYGYYPTISAAVQACIKKYMMQKVQTNEITSLQSFVDEVNACKTEINSLLDV